MRVGLVLFGHLRSFRQTHTSFGQLRKALEQCGEVHVFCHTWDIEESVTAAWWKEHKPDDPPPPTVNPEEIISLYHPVSNRIESSRQFEDAGYEVKSPIPLAGILSMLHSQQQAFQLLKDHEKHRGYRYDIVIKSRYDLLYELAPSFTDLVDRSVSENCLFLPTSNPYEPAGAFSDVFAMGPGSLMEEYFSFCDHFKEATTLYSEMGYQRLVPELCMSVYLKSKKLELKELTGLRIHILRNSGEKFQINTAEDFNGNSPHCFHQELLEKNIAILPPGAKPHTLRLVRKYMGWLDSEADETIRERYADFYNGKWPGRAAMVRLARLARHNRIFTPGVMQDFFEAGLRNAGYGLFKKLIMALLLMIHGGYGLFYFKVCWKIIMRK